MKNKILLISAMLIATEAHSAFEDKFIASLEAGAKFKCKDTPQHDGSFCVSADKSTFIVIPRGMRSHDRTVFYAHGLTGVCQNPGASGENYLKDESPTLLRLNAIGVMPYRARANDESFPMSAFVKKVEKALGSEAVPLTFAGHSAAGSFLGAELSTSPKLLARVDQVLLLDAIYGEDRVVSLWQKALSINSELKIRVVSSTTAARSNVFAKRVNAKFPGAVSVKIKGDRHCAMPKYFSEL